MNVAENVAITRFWSRGPIYDRNRYFTVLTWLIQSRSWSERQLVAVRTILDWWCHIMTSEFSKASFLMQLLISFFSIFTFLPNVTTHLQVSWLFLSFCLFADYLCLVIGAIHTARKKARLYRHHVHTRLPPRKAHKMIHVYAMRQNRIQIVSRNSIYTH
jgi:hypothetical protein